MNLLPLLGRRFQFTGSNLINNIEVINQSQSQKKEKYE